MAFLPPTQQAVIDAPKALLHDHLDGGLRPLTILEIADEIGHQLPETNSGDLAEWFVRGAKTRDINKYLATFEHTLAVMQRPQDCHRVAFEAALDLAADGVVYAEIRFAPELHQDQGMALDEIMEAVQDGLRAGCAKATAQARPIEINTIVSAMRQAHRSAEMAALTVSWQKRYGRVVGFDLAGPETGFPPTDHREALELIRRSPVHLTLHASENPGCELIEQALTCGAERIGHGIRLLDDISVDPDGSLRLGSLACHILERQIPLEMAPSCHVQIGAIDTFADHPLALWHRHGFRVTINTDNRLMSDVTVSSETAAVAETFSMSWDELGQIAIAAMESSFGSAEQSVRIAADMRQEYLRLASELPSSTE